MLSETAKTQIGLLFQDFVPAERATPPLYPPVNGKRIALSSDEFPVPELLLLTLRDGLSCEVFGPFEKCRWSVPLVYQGVPFAIELQKFGLVAVTIEDDARVMPLVPRFLGRLRKAVKAAEASLATICKSQLVAGRVTVANHFHDLDGMYRFFRKKAEEAYRRPDGPMRVTARDEDGEPCGWAGSIGEGPREGYYLTTAMLNAYFSLLEHLLVTLVPFSKPYDPAFDLLRHIGSTWEEKYRFLFDIASDLTAKGLYDRLGQVKERYRNSFSHGQFEKGGASLFFHLPSVGALPASLTGVRDCAALAFLPIPQPTYQEICKLFNEVDAYLLNGPTRYGMTFIKAGLDVCFDDDSRARYAAAMASEEAFIAFVDRVCAEMDRHANMDY